MQFTPPLHPPLHGQGLRQTTLARPLPIPGENLTLVGHSRAADSTSFFIPELALALDAGPGAPVHTQRPTLVLITHGHSDHSYGITALVSRVKPPRFCVPKASSVALEDYLFASQILSNASETPMAREEYATNHYIVPVAPGDVVPINEKAGLELEIVSCDHSCDTVGYAAYRVKEVLRDELKGLSGAELKRLRTETTEPITRRVRKPLFAFMGDTTTVAFQNASWLPGMPVVITECTFLHEAHRANAERTKHTLWSDLVPIVTSHPDTTFILIHFSHQYSSQEIITFFKELPDPPSNITIWLQCDED
ncbi:beta-lactamase-like protein [Auriculariales sp. MPI-PUGE-AT-0066]|nr:beta-lactamase-like protein [Auriculariales sp. MPI-PUGE-AT-0066]